MLFSETQAYYQVPVVLFKLKKLEEALDWDMIDGDIDLKTARYVWQNDWRQKLSRITSPLLTSGLMFLCLQNYSYFIENHSLEEYSLLVDNSSQALENAALEIESTTKSTGIAKITGGSTSLLAGTVGLAGVFLAPVTGGISLGLTIGTLTTSLAGGATSLTATIVKNRKTNKTVSESSIYIAKSLNYTVILKQLVNEVVNSFENIKRLMKDMDFESFQDNLQKCKTEKEALDYVQRSGSIGWDLFVGINSIPDLNIGTIVLKGVNASVFNPLVKVSGQALKVVPSSVTTAGQKIAVFFQAGAVGSKLLGSLAGVIAIAGSVLDINEGKKDFKKSELAEELKELAKAMVKTKEELLTAIVNMIEDLDEKKEKMEQNLLEDTLVLSTN